MSSGGALSEVTEDADAKEDSTDMNNDVADSMAVVPSNSDRYHWTNDRVKKLIDLHTNFEDLFSKPSTKKITIWKQIAAEMNDAGQSNGSVRVTGIQCEQKCRGLRD